MPTGLTSASGPRSDSRSGAAATVEPEALVVSHYLDPGQDGSPYSATIRLTGRRGGIDRFPGPRDTFVQEDRIDRIVPGSGPLSVTSWVFGLEPGEWTVSAELLRPGNDAGRGRRVAEPIPSAAWSWPSWTLAAGARGPVRTRWAMLTPLARMPGVIPGSFTVLGALGILVALVMQSAILAGESIALSESILVFTIALVVGLLGAKVWYAVLHPGPWRRAILGGWAVDGFLVVAPAAAVVALFAMGLPVGLYLDASAPGIFLAVAIGRWGCFFTGCCAGRVTRSRWGVWSSDRDSRIGARRIPTQLMESGAGLVIGVAALLLVLSDAIEAQGAIFVGAVAAYFFIRQRLLRLRAERRESLWRRTRPASGDAADGRNPGAEPS